MNWTCPAPLPWAIARTTPSSDASWAAPALYVPTGHGERPHAEMRGGVFALNDLAAANWILQRRFREHKALLRAKAQEADATLQQELASPAP